MNRLRNRKPNLSSRRRWLRQLGLLVLAVIALWRVARQRPGRVR